MKRYAHTVNILLKIYHLGFEAVQRFNRLVVDDAEYEKIILGANAIYIPCCIDHKCLIKIHLSGNLFDFTGVNIYTCEVLFLVVPLQEWACI